MRINSRIFFYFNKLNRETQHIHLWLADVIVTPLPRVFMLLSRYKHTRNCRQSLFVTEINTTDCLKICV